MNDIAAKYQAVPGMKTTRLLIPVDATDRSRWGLRYALRLQKNGIPLHAALLFVAEPVTRLEVLRFRTHEDIASFQAESGRHILDDAAQALVDAGIAHEQIYREGDIVFQILDVAEQLGCHEIVLPMPRPPIASLLRRDVVRELMRQEREAIAITVDAEGRNSLNRPC